MDMVRKLAKALASNQDKVRRRAQKQVRIILSKKSLNRKDNWTYEQMLGICKGLHYSLWMQDKLLLKEQTVTRLCDILLNIPDNTVLLYYSYAMFEILAREWDNLDYWRVDKFMLLAREFFTSGLQFISYKKPAILPSFVEAIFTKVLNNDTDHAIGLKIHFCTIIGEELSKKNVKTSSVKLIFQHLLVLLASLPKHNVYSHSVLNLITQMTKLIRRRPRCCLDGIIKCLENILSKKCSYKKALKRINTNLGKILSNREATLKLTSDQVSTQRTKSSPETASVIPCSYESLNSKGGLSENKIEKKETSEVSKKKKKVTKKRPYTETADFLGTKLDHHADDYAQESHPKRTKPEVSTESVRKGTEIPCVVPDFLHFSAVHDESKRNIEPFKSNSLVSDNGAISEKCIPNTPLFSERRVSFGKVFRKKFNAARCISLTPPVSDIPAKGILRSNSK
ncbi:Ribosomal RNA processing protein 1 like [Schistosoma japonicum]|nr:Ribosomal RNA processing protein 1 like [Schistosoma japonicum]